MLRYNLWALLLILSIVVCILQSRAVYQQWFQPVPSIVTFISPVKSVKSSHIQHFFVLTKRLTETLPPLDESKNMMAEAPAPVFQPEFPAIQLIGIIASSNPGQSLAIVNLEGKQKLLGMGQRIGNTQANLSDITDSQITMTLSGRNQTLKIPPRFHTPEVANITVKRPNQSKANALKRLQNALLDNPNRLTEFIRFNPVIENNTIVAYRISAGSSPEIFAASNLKNDDLVTEISSAEFFIPLTDSNALDSLWAQMRNVDEITLHVVREGQAFEVIIAVR